MKKLTKVIFICVFLIIISFIIFPLINSAETEENKIYGSLLFKTNYSACKHQEIYETNSFEFFDDENDIKAKYPSWNLTDISNKKIYLEKQKQGYCPNHFFAILNDDKITITKLNTNSVYNEFYISLKYLTSTDIKELENGITFNSQKELTQFLEDFTS